MPLLDDARALWQACFDDDEAFVNFYFEHCASASETIVRYHGGEPIGHIGTPRYRIGISTNVSINAVYISGACVLPEYRTQGIMKQMMAELMQGEKEADAVFLIPANPELRSYYQRTFGFETISERITSSSLPLEPTPTIYSAEQSLAEALAVSRSQIIGVQHSPRQIDNIIREYQLYPQTFILHDNEGIALGRKTKSKLYIDYLIGLPQGLDGLITSNIELDIRLDQPPKGNQPYNITPWGMLRPLSLMPWLKAWHINNPNQVYSFSYTDKLLPHLSGSYTMNSSGVHFVARQKLSPELSLTEFARLFIPHLDLVLLHE